MSSPINNSRFLNPTPDHLVSPPSELLNLATSHHLEMQRALVLDYLCHNCHTETARAFARESAVRHLDADGDEIVSLGKDARDTPKDLTSEVLRLVGLRQQIRKHLLSGRVDEATGLLNEHFPVVLSETELDTPQPTSPRKSASGLAPTSVDPTHLSLNLRILAFTEASRTVPLEYNPSPHPDEADDPSSFTLPAKSTPSPKSSIYDQDDPETKQRELLCLAQRLYSSANQLQNANARAAYLKELGNVGGLLAYKHPESSPMAKYLSHERREAVADQIDTAILYRTGRPAVSNLELYTRYTSVVWFSMHELGIKPPPLAKRPLGVQLPPTNRNKTANPPSTKGSPEKEGLELVPPFNLRQYLDTKT